VYLLSVKIDYTVTVNKKNEIMGLSRWLCGLRPTSVFGRLVARIAASNHAGGIRHSRYLISISEFEPELCTYQARALWCSGISAQLINDYN
jgi:hypothetical protein